jgi:hypothetical protein
MRKNTLIEHKEAIVVCEESGHVSMNYNALLTTLQVNAIVKHVVHVVTTKSTLTCTNCGKIGHSMETYHNRKRKVPIVSIATIKFIEHVARTKTQPIKSRKIFVCYPCIICYSVKHIFGKCPKKIEVQNMFRIKLVSSNVMITSKSPKTNDVSINVVVVVTTQNNKCSRGGNQLKPKELKIGNKKSIYNNHSLKLLNSYNIVGLKTNPLPLMKVHYKVIGLIV